MPKKIEKQEQSISSGIKRTSFSHCREVFPLGNSSGRGRYVGISGIGRSAKSASGFVVIGGSTSGFSSFSSILGSVLTSLAAAG